ncbi:MAG: N(4)-(beta-N-acetylglucosaminyl)-L-asparaginase, partial [Stenotrophomonas sp.]
MSTRRQFLQSSAMLGVLGSAAPGLLAAPATPSGARVVSTWDFGVGANQAAWKVLAAGGSALDAVEAGARWAESE